MNICWDCLHYHLGEMTQIFLIGKAKKKLQIESLICICISAIRYLATSKMTKLMKMNRMKRGALIMVTTRICRGTLVFDPNRIFGMLNVENEARF